MFNITANNEIRIDYKPTGWYVTQEQDSTRVYNAAGDTLTLPHTRYALSHDAPASGVPGRKQFEIDFCEAIGKPLYDYYTLQYKPMNGWCVYGWGTYPEHSVLAGQPMKCFLDSYGEGDEGRAAALAAYPQATPSSEWTEPKVSLDHLPGEDDPVPGGMWPDDID